MTEYTPLDIVAGMNNGEFHRLKEETFTCPSHGEYTGRTVVFREIKVDPPCPKCKDEQEKLEVTEIDWKIRLSKTRLRAEYRDASFENFNAYTPELEKHLKMARHFAENPKGNLVMMSAGNGAGKNHLAAAILKRCGGAIYTVYELSSRLRKTYNEREGETEYEILEELSRLNLLVLDEIGRHKGSDWDKNWLSYLLNNRYNDGLSTIFITNKHFNAACQHGGCPDCLSNFLGKDIISRILQNSVVMTFACPDYRMKLGADFQKARLEEMGHAGL